MKISVLIPTYCRTNDLKRCLDALSKQNRQADEILVVVRDTDQETWNFIESFDESNLLRAITVKTPGQNAALNAGLDAISGDIIAITDDDAAPHADWLNLIEMYFRSDDRIGGVGGRDWVYFNNQLIMDDPRKGQLVGKVQWFGRVIWNHEFGVGEAREVDVLKGANMSFRRTAIENLRFDRRMRGKGSEIASDTHFCLCLKREGWKLIYDPKIAVDHHLGKRHDKDQREGFDSLVWTNIIHNRTLMMLEHLPPQRQLVFFFWALLLGTRGSPGIVQWLRFLPTEGSLSGQKLAASLRGRWQGWQTWIQTRNVPS